MVYVHDIDAHYAHAVAEGADITMAIEDAFYGERRYEATDLEGHRWHFAERFVDMKARGRYRDSPAAAFAAALAVVPQAPGVYFFLGARAAFLYVGKAGDLRAGSGSTNAPIRGPGTRTHDLYQRVREIRWDTTADEASRHNREADLIVGLQPAVQRLADR